MCAVAGCEKEKHPKAGYGMCRPHYRALQKWGERLHAPVINCLDCTIEFIPKNGGHVRCGNCATMYNRATEKEYREENREKITQYNREWRARNPSYHSEYNRNWRAAHREEYLAYSAQYRAEHSDEVRRRHVDWESRHPRHAQEWAEKNRERARETVRRRRARMRMVSAYVISDRDIRRLLQRHRYCCAYCNRPLEESYHMDHVFPVSLGGSNGIGNLVPACPDCNVSKSNWFLSEWRYRDRLSHPLRRRSSRRLAGIGQS